MLEHKEITEKADVYSFAVVMWCLLTAKEPYSELNEFQVITGVLTENLRPEIPENCLPEYAELMKQCWAKNPEERPSFDVVLRILKQIKRGLSCGVLSPSSPPMDEQKQALEHDSVLKRFEQFEYESSEDSNSSGRFEGNFVEISIVAEDVSPRMAPLRLTSPISIMNRRRTLSIDTPPPSVSFAEEVEKSPRK